MQLTADAIVLAVRSHGEHGAVVRLLTPDHGVLPGYVRGGRSRALRPVLIPGNLVRAEYRARTADQLAALTVELLHSRAPLLAEPLAAAAIDWATALGAVALPEGQPYPALHAGLDGLLGAIEAAPSAGGWTAGLARYEALLISQLGFGGIAPDTASTDATMRSLRATGSQLERHILEGRRAEVLASRDRLMDRLKAIAGAAQPQ